MMSQNEFGLIDTYFKHKNNLSRSDVILGIGDDCAILRCPQGYDLACTTDTLIEGVHFPANTPAADIAYKALTVNLSDLAAMGATPAWATLALTLPKVDKNWLEAFSDSFFSLANEFKLQLVGGDTTQGLLSITIQLQGFVPQGSALTRSGAKPGDSIFVTGELGLGGWGLAAINQAPEIADRIDHSQAIKHFYRPHPRVVEGQKLHGLASACIDISDGLAADLGHILESSQVGATIWEEKIPIPDNYRNKSTFSQALNHALYAGDDYELCFTIPSKIRQSLNSDHWLLVECNEIGKVEAQSGLRLTKVNTDGIETTQEITPQGYKHFK